MVELLRTNDLVLVSALEAFLTSAGIGYFVADRHMSATEGSLGFLPVRLMVEAERAAQARELVKGAGFEVTFSDG